MQSWELILDAGGAIKNVIDAKKVKIHEFFADVLGGEWASFLPNLFTSHGKYLLFNLSVIPNLYLSLLYFKTHRRSLIFFLSFADFSWDSLGLFDYKSNIQDLVSLDQLHNFQVPQNLGELYTKLDTVTDAWCDEAE
jgi:hypothetical protein